MKNILLVSNSICQGRGYLEHCILAIKNIIGGNNEILFIPFALKDWDKYEKIAKTKFEKEGIVLKSIHHEKDYKDAVKKAKVLFVGGGNTFRLLNMLQKQRLIKIIKSRVESGKLIYIGVSAGSNIAGLTIKTTNDMPIVEVDNLSALALVNFQINPHYIDPEKNPKHKIETRDERINQFHEENNTPVIGLREGAYLIIKGGKIILDGSTGAKLFQKGKEPVELKGKCLLNF